MDGPAHRVRSSLLDSATTTSDSRRGPSMPKAMTLPARTPSSEPTARSTSSGNTLRPPTMITSLMRPHATAGRRACRPEVAGPQPAVVEQGGVGRRAPVVAGRHGRARISSSPTSVPQRGAVVRVDDADLQAGHGPAEQRQPAAAGGPRLDLGRVALGLQHPAVDAVGDQARGRLGNVPAMATSAMPKAGNTTQAAGRGGRRPPRTPPPGRGRSARPVEGDAQPREVVGSPGSGPGWPARS